MNQQGDVALVHSADGGEICVENGIVTMSGGLETTAYLSLFGGNQDDNGLAQSNKNWWGNLSEVDRARQYRSETQFLLKSISPTSSNLRKVEDAAIRDLKWLLDSKAASEIRVFASMPAIHTVKISIEIEAIGEETEFEFTANWKAAS